jgi:integrase
MASVKESTGTENETEARKILRARLAAVDRGEVVETGRVKVVDLYDELREHVKANQRGRGERSLEELGWRWKHLGPVFGHMRASTLATKSITAYTVLRQEEEAADATINRELATLRRMLNFGRQANRLKTVPWIPMLKEDNARQGFVEDVQFERLVAEAKEPWLETFLELAYSYGWRRAELLGLRVRQVNLGAGTIRLDSGATKNGDGREVAMTPRVRELLEAATKGKRWDAWVLSRDPAGKKQVRDFRVTWENLTAAAGVPDLMVHDFRRSAAKALRRAGVPESVIMSTGGWRTASMFRRYAIVSATDQREAVALLEAARERDRAKRPVLVPFLQKERIEKDVKVG